MLQGKCSISSFHSIFRTSKIHKLHVPNAQGQSLVEKRLIKTLLQNRLSSTVAGFTFREDFKQQSQGFEK
jgi:hypothetical protein